MSQTINNSKPLIVAFLCIVAIPGSVIAQPAPLRHSISVQEAFLDSSRPFVRRMRYTPITVTISNSGPKTVPGVLRIYRTEAPKTALAKRPLYYSKRVNVPPGTRRETIHYFVQTNLVEDCLAVVFEPDPNTNEAVTDPIFPGYRILSKQVAVLVVSAEAAPRGMFVGARVAGVEFQSTTVVSELQPQDIPDSRLGYDAFSVVVLHDCDLSDVSKIQRRALADWVSNGGTVLIVPGNQPFFSRRHGLRTLLPIESTGKVVDKEWSNCEFLGGVSGPGQMRIHDLKAKPNCSVLERHEDGDTMIVSGRFGSGSVKVFAFPISSLNMRQWIFARSLFSRMLPQVYENDSAILTVSPIMEWQLNRTSFFKGSSPVSILIIGPILFLYAFLVCPVAFHFGRRKRSPAMFIAAMGAVILLTLVSVVAIVVVTRASGSKAAINSLVTVPYFDDNSEVQDPTKFESKIESVVGSVHHQSGRLNVEAQRNTMTAPWLTTDRQIQGEITETGLNQATIQNQRVISWSFQRFYQRSYQKLGHLSGSLGIDKDYIVGELKNNTELNIENAFVLFGGQIAEVGALQPKQSQNSRVPLYPMTVSSKIFKHFAAELTKNLNDYHRFFFEGLSSEEFDVNTHLLKMFRNFSHTGVTSGSEPAAFLIAFANDSGAQFQSNFGEKLDSKSSLIVSRIPLRLAKDRIRMIELHGLVCAPTQVDVSGEKETDFNLEAGINLDPISVINFSFAVPKLPDHSTELEKLTIAMNLRPNPVIRVGETTKDLIVEIFSPRTKKYELLARWDGKKFRSRINDPGRFFDRRTHQVRIRLQNTTATSSISVSSCRARFMAKYKQLR